MNKYFNSTYRLSKSSFRSLFLFLPPLFYSYPKLERSTHHARDCIFKFHFFPHLLKYNFAHLNRESSHKLTHPHKYSNHTNIFRFHLKNKNTYHRAKKSDLPSSKLPNVASFIISPILPAQTVHLISFQHYGTCWSW